MFTGLVQAVGTISAHAPTPNGLRLHVKPPSDRASFAPPAPGDSISVSGCCLTLVEHVGSDWAFDLVPETLARTKLAQIAELPSPQMRRVNLETSCTPTTLLGGHIVQGHVDALGSVLDVQRVDQWRIRIGAPPEIIPLLPPKGSVAVDGVSLTVARVDIAQRFFEVALIPTTLAMTTLSDLAPGHAVHLEADCFVKAIVHHMDARAILDHHRAARALSRP